MPLALLVCAIFGLAFAIKQTDGPWDIITKWRNLMMRLPLVGPQFYKLLDCFYCTGFWSGLVIYFLTQESYKLGWAICWGLAGGTICLVVDGVISKLHQQ